MSEIKKSLVYLATPYSSPDAFIREIRFNIVNKVAANLIKQGLHIFSPISHSHPLAMVGDLPKGFDFWVQYDRAFLECCQKLLVLRLDGWQDSKGVNGEMQIAKELNIPIEFMDFDIKDYK